MGLDIFLVRYENYAVDKPIQEEFNHRVDSIIVNSKNTQNVDERIEALKREFGLDDFGKRYTKIEHNSQRYPDHLFKIGYYRSSYNSGGINNVLRCLYDTDLYKLFGIDYDQIEVKTDWQLTKNKVHSLSEKIKDEVAKKTIKLESLSINLSAEDVLWYVQALEIIEESCDWVLAQNNDEQSKYWLRCCG